MAVLVPEIQINWRWHQEAPSLSSTPGFNSQWKTTMPAEMVLFSQTVLLTPHPTSKYSSPSCFVCVCVLELEADLA